MATDSDLKVDFYSYGADPRVSIGFDANGNIAAVRTAVRTWTNEYLSVYIMLIKGSINIKPVKHFGAWLNVDKIQFLWLTRIEDKTSRYIF